MKSGFNPHMEGGSPLSEMFNPHESGAIPIESNSSQSPQEDLFNPAFMSASGSVIPQSAYDNPATRMAASVLPTLAVPEVAIGGRFIAPLINAASRIGAGTAGNLAYQSPEIKNMQDFKQKASGDLGFNALLEGAIAPLHALNKISEFINPLQYARNKAQQIKNEFHATQATQREAYRPVNEQYGEMKVTDDPKNYLNFEKQDTRYFTPDVRKKYNDFIENPTFSNLHGLQSQMGKDWSRISTNPNKINTSQSLDMSREGVKNKIQEFLSNDENALNQYNLGSAITKNQLMPYLSNPTLRKIAYGKMQDISPSKLSNAIEQGSQKSVGGIPEGHALNNHLNDLKNRINLGKALQTIIPATTGAVIGEHFLPGAGGAATGAAALLGVNALSKIASKYGAPSVTEFVQNPLVRNLTNKYLSPIYYGSGRALIGSESK